MDPNHGKRSGGSEEAQEKEEEHLFPIYSDRSQQDMSAMVSALAQVIGASPTLTDHMTHSTSEPNAQPSLQPDHQGIPLYVYVHI